MRRGRRYPDPLTRWQNQTCYAGDCIIWTGKVSDGGYGIVVSQGSHSTRKCIRAHRYFYEFFVGPIPDGLVINHLCSNRICVNPSHMQVCTNAENVMHPNSQSLSRIKKAQTHCKRGHEFNSENTRVGKRNRRRTCIPCFNMLMQKRRGHHV